MIGRSKKLRKKNDIAFETQDFKLHSVFPSIIAILFSFRTKRGQLFKGR